MWVRTSILTIILCMLSACAGRQPQLAGQPGPAPEQILSVLPGIASEQPRAAMIAGAQPADANNLLARSASAGPVGSSMMLNSSAEVSSWALWGWYGLNSTVFPERIRISLSTPEEDCHVLLADFAMKRWRTLGPLQGSVIEISPAEHCDRVLGRDGVFYVAILASDGSRPVISGISIVTGNDIEMPAPVLWCTASQGSQPDRINLAWEASPLSSAWTLRRVRLADPEDLTELAVECCSYVDEDVIPGELYSYSVVCANLHGSAASGPPVLGHAGQLSGARLSGSLHYDSSHPAAGIPLQLGNGLLISSSGSDGSFSFAGLSPGLWTLWRCDSQPRVQLGQFVVSSADVSTGAITLARGGTPQLGWHWIYPPQNLHVSASTDDSVTLKWQEAERATRYEVLRGRFTDPYWAELQAVTELNSIALTNQGNGQYYYWVRSREELDGFTRISAVGQACGHLFPDKGLLPDTIYAIPDRTSVAAGEIVTFTVMVHETAHPLNFVNSVRVTFEEGNQYVSGSFNPGSVGGGVDKADGIWQYVDPADGFLPLDSEVLGQQDPVNGRSAIDFNVTPLGGSEIELATGALFNFRLRIHTDVTLSFQTSNELLRTYYSDGSQQHENVWTHDDNMGMPVVRVVN
ncbi:fibronectin type III domain-containing protein [bacterium]|nr:fibronectin type III domain-containing protein [bacterium]